MAIGANFGAGSSWWSIAYALSRATSFKRNPHFAKTASATLKASQTGSTFTNLGATATVALTLPQNADYGIMFRFHVQAAQLFRIDPGAAGAFYYNGAKQTDGKYLELSGIGAAVEVECDGNHDWVVRVVGTAGGNYQIEA